MLWRSRGCKRHDKRSVKINTKGNIIARNISVFNVSKCSFSSGWGFLDIEGTKTENTTSKEMGAQMEVMRRTNFNALIKKGFPETNIYFCLLNLIISTNMLENIHLSVHEPVFCITSMFAKWQIYRWNEKRTVIQQTSNLLSKPEKW